MTATFPLIALFAGGYEIARKSLATICFRLDVIKREFCKFIIVSAINTLTIEVLFNSSSPELLSV
jgi:hypothetical protein